MPNSTFTMTQLADAKRIYQRATTSGGGQGKGQGTIPVTINVTVAGTLHARIRDGGGVTILQAAYSLGTVSTGSQTANVTGVDARLGWFFVDLSGDGGATWTNGTTLVGMGRLTGLSGQSLAVRMLNTTGVDTTNTNASLGVTIDPNGTVYARGDSNPSPANWRLPADGSYTTEYNSTFVSEFLRLEIAAAGVNCAVVGSAVGQTNIYEWIPGGDLVATLQTILDAVGGFEAFIWFQGHTDARDGMSNATYQADLTALFNNLAAHNAARGSSFEKYLASIPDITTGVAWGTPKQITSIRNAQASWAANNSATYVGLVDLEMVSDGIHPNNIGARTIARHFYRSTRPALGLSHGDTGPSISSVTRASGSANVVVNFSLPAGATALAGAGSLATRFRVASRGDFNARPITSATVGTSSVTLALTQTPADNAPLDVWFGYPPDPQNDGGADMLRDNNTDGDGVTVGRSVYASLLASAVPAPSSAGPTLTANSATWAASSETAFGQCLTGGYGNGAAPLADDVIPWASTLTVECRFKISSIPGNNKVMFGGGGTLWVGVAPTTGFLTGSAIDGTHNVCDGNWHHVRLVCDDVAGTQKLYLDGALEGSAGRYTPTTSAGHWDIGTFLDSPTFQWPGSINEFAAWSIATNSASFTPPAAPYAGNEAGLYSLYHLDGNFSAATLTSPSTTLAPAASSAATSSANVTLGYTAPGGGGGGGPLTVALNSRTSTAITFDMGGRTPGSYDTIEFQYATRPDFSFGVAPLADFATAASITLQSLNQGNTYFVRAREKASGSGAVGPWATTPPVYLPLGTVWDATPQSVLLRPAIIVVPEPVTWTAPTPDASHPADNLNSDAPTEQCWTSGTALYFDTAGQPIDTIALLGTNLPAGVNWRVEGYGSVGNRAAGTSITYATTDAPFQASANLPGRPYYHGLIRLPAPRTDFFWKIIFTAASGSFPPASVIAAMFGVVGLSRTARNIAADSAVVPVDFGALDRQRDGTPDRRYGWRGRKLDFELALLTEAQWETQFADLRSKVGLVDPVLVVPNTRTGSFLHDRILYGPLTAQRKQQPSSARFTVDYTIDSLI